MRTVGSELSNSPSCIWYCTLINTWCKWHSWNRKQQFWIIKIKWWRCLLDIFANWFNIFRRVVFDLYHYMVIWSINVDSLLGLLCQAAREKKKHSLDLQVAYIILLYCALYACTSTSARLFISTYKNDLSADHHWQNSAFVWVSTSGSQIVGTLVELLTLIFDIELY